MDSQIDLLHDELRQKNQQIQALLSEQDILQDKLTHAESDIQAAAEAGQNLLESVQNLKNELNDSQKIAAESTNLRAENRRLQARCEEFQFSLSLISDSAFDDEGRLRKLQNRVSESEQNQQNDLLELNRFKQELEYQKNLNVKLETENAQLKQELSTWIDWSKDQESLQSTVDDLYAELDASKTSASEQIALARDLEEANRSCESLHTKLTDEYRKRNELEDEVYLLKQEVEQLRALNEDGEAELNRTLDSHASELADRDSMLLSLKHDLVKQALNIESMDMLSFGLEHLQCDEEENSLLSTSPDELEKYDSTAAESGQSDSI